MSMSDLFNIRKAIREEREQNGAGAGLIEGKVHGAQGLRGRLCAFCREQEAKYVCPSCNAAYCTRTCYSSRRHASCSAVFAQRSAQESRTMAIPLTGGEDGAPLDEAARLDMMDVLKRLQEQALSEMPEVDDAPETEGQDGHVDELTQYASSEELLALLTPEERSSFHRMLRQPESGERLMASLLRGDGQQNGHTLGPGQLASEPWWASATSLLNGPEASSLSQMLHVNASHAIPEEAEKDFAGSVLALLTQMSASHPGARPRDLRYNFLALVMAYVFVVKHLDSPSLMGCLRTTRQGEEAQLAEAQAIWTLLDRLAPFFTASAPRSAPESDSRLASTVLDSAEDSSFWFLSRLGVEEAGKSPAALLLGLLKDAHKIMSPAQVSAAAATDDSGSGDQPRKLAQQYSQSQRLLAAVFDLWVSIAPMLRAQDGEASSRTRKQASAMRAKLVFYLAQFLSLHDKGGSVDFAKQIEGEQMRLENELQGAERQDQLKAKEQFELEQARLQQPAAHRLPGGATGLDSKVKQRPLIEVVEEADDPPSPAPKTTPAAQPQPRPKASTFKELKMQREAQRS